MNPSEKLNEGGVENNSISFSESKQKRERMLQSKEIMGEKFFGREEIEKAFQVKVTPEIIPMIPFEKADLEKAKELGQYLILRINQAPNGEPLTIAKINELLRGKLNDGGKTLLHGKDGKIEPNYQYAREKFLIGESPRPAWALVGQEIVPDSSGKDYLSQTEVIVDYSRNHIFKGLPISPEFQAAIAEFEKEKEAIRTILKSDWKAAAERLANLPINKLARLTPVELFYDLIVYFQNKGKRLLSDNPRFAWTGGTAANGELVRGGYFTANGVSFSTWGPDGSDSYTGALFSRTAK